MAKSVRKKGYGASSDVLLAYANRSGAPAREFASEYNGGRRKRKRHPKYEHARRRVRTPPTSRDDGSNIADYYSPLRAA